MSIKAVPNVCRFKIPDYKYIYPSAWAPYTAESELARLRLLQACERLNIEVELGQIDLHILPDNGGATLKGWTVQLPSIDLECQSETEWRRQAQAVFDEECIQFIKWVRASVDKRISSGKIVPVKRIRTGGKNAPLDLRYEWAAKRYILDMDYKEIATGKYNAGQVKQAVQSILKEAGLPIEK